MQCYLRERRMEKHLKQKELAEMLGLNKSYLHKIEKGHVEPGVTTALRIAHALNCRVEDVWVI